MAKNEINFDALSVQELNHLLEDAKIALEGKKQGAKAQFIDEMHQKAAQLGLDLSELLTQLIPRTSVRKPRIDAGKTVAAKYRSPEGKIWTGRGRMPRWLTDAMHHGKVKEDFAV